MYEVGQIVQLLKSYSKDAPLPATCGTITKVDKDFLDVDWNDGKKFRLVIDIDDFRIIEKEK